MLIPLSCPHCINQGHPFTVVANLAPSNTGLYKIRCNRDHETVFTLSNHEFEMLSVIARNAIVDHYHRESVSSFTSSLERYYEFKVKILILHHLMVNKSVPENEALEAMDSYWKSVSNQSERQLGSYLALMVMDTGSTPKLIPNKMVEFRNKVIHKGYIPTEDEAINYGQHVIDIIQPSISNDVQSHPDAWSALTRQMFRRRHESIPKGDPVHLLDCSSPYGDKSDRFDLAANVQISREAGDKVSFELITSFRPGS